VGHLKNPTREPARGTAANVVAILEKIVGSEKKLRQELHKKWADECKAKGVSNGIRIVFHRPH